MAGCELAKTHGVAAAYVKPYFVKPAVGLLRDATVSVCTLAAFAPDNSPVRIKLTEIEEVMAGGVVVKFGMVLGENWDDLAKEMARPAS